MARCSAITGDIFSRHDLEAHDESSARLEAVCRGIPGQIRIIEPTRASEDDLLRVHTHSHIRMIRDLSTLGGQHFIDPNTYITGASFEVASYAVGAAIQAAHQALDGEHCFALIRPPGHHAEPDCAMGFCLFNNAAIAASAALDRVSKVAIIDWDLHHGNGTQKIFYNNDRVLYCSIHQGNIFPHTGWIDEIGTGKGKGFNINAPLRQGSNIADYHLVFEEVFIPALNQFRPDLVIVSAGQDALSDDPKSGMMLLPEDFCTLTALLRETTDHPLACILEGGYGPSHEEAISMIFSGLLGSSCVSDSQQQPHRPTREVVELLKKMMI